MKQGDRSFTLSGNAIALAFCFEGFFLACRKGMQGLHKRSLKYFSIFLKPAVLEPLGVLPAASSHINTAKGFVLWRKPTLKVCSSVAPRCAYGTIFVSLQGRTRTRTGNI